MYPNYNNAPGYPNSQGNPSHHGNPTHIVHHSQAIMNQQSVSHHIQNSQGQQVHQPPSIQNSHNSHNSTSNYPSSGFYSLAPGGFPAAPRVGYYPVGNDFIYPSGHLNFYGGGDRNMYGFNLSQPNGFHTEAHPEAQQWYNVMEREQYGKINARELQAALFNGQGRQFSENVCHLMVNIFDKTRSGTMDIRDFHELYQYINNWMNVFHMYDKENNGYLEEAELTLAVQQMGFRFSADFFRVIVSKTDTLNQKNISAEQFIVFCVQLQRFTEIFRLRLKEPKDAITIGFEDFLKIIYTCST